MIDMEICDGFQVQIHLKWIRKINHCALINIRHSPYMKGMLLLTPFEWEMIE